MAMVTSTAIALAGLLMAAGSAGYQVSEAEAAKSNAKDEMGRKKQEQYKAVQDADLQNKKNQEDEAKATAVAEQNAKTQEMALAAREEAKRRRGTYGGSTPGRRGTILTSPLGQIGQSGGSSGTQRTLLGA